MSDRLLRESDVIEAVTQYISSDYSTEEMAREDAELLIGQIPSADRPQGEWIRIECNENIEGHIVPMRIYKCSTCGEKEVALTRFCPNCGADMRKREGE